MHNFLFMLYYHSIDVHMAITIPLIDDLHVHLRQGDMMEAVVPSISNGGVGRVLVMPNLSPPITTVAQAAEYRTKLVKLNPAVEYFMTLYLTFKIPIIFYKIIYNLLL